MADPTVSVVVVIDYKVGEDGGLGDLGLTLRALARQDYDEPAEFLLVEAQGGTPPDLDGLEAPADLRVTYVPAETSYDLKNEGARAARADLVVILDADCVPEPGWLSAAVAHHRAHPRAAAISGRTLYRARGLLPRIFALLDRSYVGADRPGPAGAISNNNAAFRRDVMVDLPLRNDLGTFGSKLHSEAIAAAGGALRYEPAMVVRHAYGGWRMQRLARLHMGYAMARHRRLDPAARHAWMFGIGAAGLPFILAMAVAGSWKNCLRRARGYGVRWWQVPLAMAVAVPVHAMEMPGVLLALRGRRLSYGEGYV